MSCSPTGQTLAAKLNSSVLAALMLACCVASGQTPVKQRAAAPQAVRPGQGSALPLVFEENLGQAEAKTLFAGRTQQYTVELRPRQMRFDLQGKDADRTITVAFSGASDGRPEGVSKASFRTNYYIGSDPKAWRTGVRNYDRVALRSLYPGIDAEFYSHDNQIEHDFILAPGADASLLAMHLSGAAAVAVTAAGDLDLKAHEGYVRFHKPNAYQTLADGSREPVDARFKLIGRGDEADLTFVLGVYDHSRQLVIDPVISYSTYVAGDQGSSPSGIVADSAGYTYITGTTSTTDVTKFGATTTTAFPATGPIATPLTFLARISPSVIGSQVDWVSYYGSPTASVKSNAIAYLPAGSQLFVGGNTTASDLPISSSTPAPTGYGTTTTASAGSTVGFVASFSGSDGSFITASYLEAATVGTPASGPAPTTTVTSVNALTVTGDGVFLAGSTTGKNLPINPGLDYGGFYPLTSFNAPLSPTGESSQQAVANSTAQKGFILELTPQLHHLNYATYVNGYQIAGSTTLTGIAVDSGGFIYISGHTSGDFPQSGIDNPSVLTGSPVPLPTPIPPSAFIVPSGKTAETGFAAKIDPTIANIVYSYWTGGAGNDLPNGLALDQAPDTNTPSKTGSLYLFGSTTSPAFTTKGLVSTSTAATIPPVASLNTATGAAGTVSGFAVNLDPGGNIVTSTYLNSGEAGEASSAVGGTVDAAHNVYIVGSTNATKASFPQNSTTPGPYAYNTLPPTEDLSQDNPGSRGYLLQMPASLALPNYIAYFGPTAGSASGVGVAVDGASSPNAYMLLGDSPAATGTDFNLSAALQPTPQATGGPVSAYVAQVAFTAPTTSPAPPYLTAGTLSYTVSGATTPPATPTPVGYSAGPPAVFSSLTLKYQVVGTGANTVVFDLPYNSSLQPYTGLPTVTVGTTPVTNACRLGTSATPGFTCVLSSGLSGGTVAEFDIPVTISASAPQSTAGFSVLANVYDAQGETVALSLPIVTAGVPALSVTDSASVSSVTAAPDKTSPGTPDSVVAANTVTYTYTIKNSNGNDSPYTTLTTNFGTGFYKTGFTSTALVSGSTTQCDFSTTACDVPGNSSVVYTVTGVYVASTFAGSGTGPFSVSIAAPVVTFSSPQLTPPVPVITGTSLTMMVQASAVLSVGLSTSSGTNSFSLGSTGVTLTAAITNSGQNQAGSGQVSVTLPKGFIVANLPANPPACIGSPQPTTCSLSFTSVGAGATVNLNLTGSFSDTGTTSDAVAPPTTTAGVPTAATVSASATSGTVTFSAPASAITLNAGSGSSPASAAASASITVTRSNNLSYNIVAGTPLGAGQVNETNPLNATDPFSNVTYTVTLQNTGTSVARGLLFTIPVVLPSNVTLGTRTIAYTTAGSTPRHTQCRQPAHLRPLHGR